jgi:histidyl-tRNA synthetase
VLNFGGAEIKYALKIIELLRNLKVKSELYPDQVKLKKQMSYADSKKIPYIIMAGEEEIKNNELTVKTMSTGEQKRIALKDIDSFVKKVIKPAE